MRCSIFTPTIILALVLAIIGCVVAEPVNLGNALLTKESIEVKVISNYLEKRQHAATTATNGTATTSGGAAPAATTTAAKKKAPSSSFASPAILQDGTLFYIATGVTCLLWATGKFIDIKMERQERYAESLIHSI